MTGVTDGGSHLRMKIILRTNLVCFPVSHVCVPECSRNGSGVRPYLWVQKKLDQFRQSTQNAGLCPAVLLGEFFSDSAFKFLRNLCDIFIVNFRNERVSCLAVPRMFLLCFLRKRCQLSFFSESCHFFEGKVLRSYED